VNNNAPIKSDDQKPRASRPTPPNRHWRLRWTALALGSVVLGVVMAKSQAPSSPGTDTNAGAEPANGGLQAKRAGELASEPLELPARAPAMAMPRPVARADGGVAQWRTLEVGAGDAFAALMDEAGVNAATVHDLTNAGEAGQALGRIFPGDRIRLGFGAEGELQRLRYRSSPARGLVFERRGDGFSGRIVEEPLQRRLQYARATIRTSLFRAGARAGVSERLLTKMARIFGWDIDFVLDIRGGDRFTLVYERFYKDGRAVRTGDIVAAEFINQGRVYRAVQYTTPDGETAYYAPDGTSMRKAFLRSPVEFTRISSKFGERDHPTLKQMRNHEGVDYAAPRGTPIRATGDGRIEYRGYNGGYGRMIVMRHGGRYSTAFAHMTRFANGTGVGAHVEQGEVIGYVGSTGRSTGPHLHYEFRVNGEHENPLTVEFPSSESIQPARLDAFRQTISPLLAQLDTVTRAYASAAR
jgi:murein DD-endopeptidase MepM/ murein hydrolase activator NlpD